jgi:NADH-quinone oxidoreductase subunit N
MPALDNRASLLLALPELTLSLGCLAVLALGLFQGQGQGNARPRGRWPLAVLTLLVLAGAIAATLATAPAAPVGLFGGLLARDRFGDFFRLLAPAVAAVTALLALRSGDALDGDDRESAEFFALLLAAVLGVMLMAGATDMLLAYLGLELVSVMSYVLTGFTRGSRRSAEASLKYVIYGGVASGCLLYGLSLLYGFAGSTDLAAARAALGAAPAPLALVAMALCLAGLGYKVAVVPFHMWAPDVYQGAPIPVAAFLSVASKAGGFALLLRFLGTTGGPLPDLVDATAGVPWSMLALVLAVITMTLGNLAALGQRNLKRLLAYSSIAHAGYLFLGVAVGAPAGHQAILFYLGVYLFVNLAAFAVVVVVARTQADEEIERWAGLGRRQPLAAFTMTVALVALAGLPPTAGFIGKYYLFAAVISRGRELGQGMFYAAALIAVLNSVVSLYYYARVVRAMYIEPAGPDLPLLRPGVPLRLLLVALLLPILALGLYWAPLDELTGQSLSLWSADD